MDLSAPGIFILYHLIVCVLSTSAMSAYYGHCVCWSDDFSSIYFLFYVSFRQAQWPLTTVAAFVKTLVPDRLFLKFLLYLGKRNDLARMVAEPVETMISAAFVFLFYLSFRQAQWPLTMVAAFVNTLLLDLLFLKFLLYLNNRNDLTRAVAEPVEAMISVAFIFLLNVSFRLAQWLLTTVEGRPPASFYLSRLISPFLLKSSPRGPLYLM